MKVLHSYYFPLTFRIFGASLPLFALLSWIKYGNIFATILIVLFGALFLTTKYITEINTKSRSIKEYLWILGLKKGESRHYDEIKNLIVNQHSIKQTYNSRGSTSTIQSDIYKLYVEIDEEKIELYQSKNNVKINKKAQRLADKLKVPLRSNSKSSDSN